MTETNETETPGHTDQLERERFEQEAEFRRQEIALREKEISAKIKEEQRSTWMSPIFLGLLAAVVGLIGNAVVSMIQGQNTALLKEREATANITLEREKLRSGLILEAIRTGDPNTAVTNLKFLVEIGFIDDADGRILAYLSEPKNVPVLPRPGFAGADYSKTALTLYNKCDEKIRALVHSRDGDGVWRTTGWWEIGPASTIDTVKTDNWTVFIYAESSKQNDKKRKWLGLQKLEFEGIEYEFRKVVLSSYFSLSQFTFNCS